MRLRNLAAAISAAVALAGAGAIAASGPASAATPSCGTSCVDIFNDQFGDGITQHAAFIVDSFKQGVAIGTPIILFRASNFDPAEDFVLENQGTVADFFGAGMVSAAFALHYGCIAATAAFHDCLYSPKDQGFGTSPDANLNAYEWEYAPFGAPSGECIGVATAPVPGEKVSLQPCGVSGKTVWVDDAFDGNGGANAFGDSNILNCGNPSGGASCAEDSVPLLNGAGNYFSHPLALTYPAAGYPTDQPRPQLYLANLTGHFTGIFPSVTAVQMDVNSNQVWDGLAGPLTH